MFRLPVAKIRVGMYVSGYWQQFLFDSVSGSCDHRNGYEGSVPCSQQPVPYLYLQPDDSGPHLSILF